MRKLAPALLLLALTLLVPAAQADSVTFTGVNGVNNGQYYVSPYFGTINGVPVTLYCVDFRNSVHIGQTWTANLSTLTNGSNLSNTRYGGLTNALALYQQAAWLTTQFASHTNDYVNLQYALWNLFTPSAPDTAGSNAWLAAAAANYASINLSNFRIVTNTAPLSLTGSNQVQEFITVVPEPASMLLFGSGMAAIAGVIRRRGKQQLAA